MRRRNGAALQPKTIIIGIIICGAVCLAGIGYVWAKTQVWALGNEIKKLEHRRDELKRNNDALQRTYAAMCTPANLGERVKELQLGLAAPLPHQIVRMPEPTPLAKKEPPQNPRFYAQSTNE